MLEKGREIKGSRIRVLPKILGRNEGGVATVEFAFVAAPFIVLILAVIQTSLIMFTQQVLETSAEKSARWILTGNAQKAGISQSAFKNKVCATLPSYMKCADLFVDVRVVNNFGAANLDRSDVQFDRLTGNIDNNTKYEPGLPGDIVTLRLMYQASVVTGPLGFNLSDMRGNRRLLLATSIFKNETY